MVGATSNVVSSTPPSLVRTGGSENGCPCTVENVVSTTGAASSVVVESTGVVVDVELVDVSDPDDESELLHGGRPEEEDRDDCHPADPVHHRRGSPCSSGGLSVRARAPADGGA